MKFLFLIASVFLVTASKENCRKQKMETSAGHFYKGKLEIKGPCMNYTISIESGNFNPNWVVRNWTNEATGKAYKNVFGLSSRCNFPSAINEGDEFYFTIDSTSIQHCMVCLIYYPTPEKKLSIKVTNTGPANTNYNLNHSTIQPLNP